MDNNLKYMPILRARREELGVLNFFDFGKRIYPCVEIIKDVNSLPSEVGEVKKTPLRKKMVKKFEDVYLPILNQIKAERVFIDLPVHLRDSKNMQLETFHFLRTVIYKRQVRTDYIKKLSPLAHKIIPVISTYYDRTTEQKSILLQENDLRSHFLTLAFRTFPDSFDGFIRDYKQIKLIVRPNDYLIVDWRETDLDLEDEEQQDITNLLKEIDCTIIVHRNPFPKKMTNTGLNHDEIIDGIDNSLMNICEFYGGSCFSDYAGVKKEITGNAPIISPGFIYYDAVTNKFYGYKGILDKYESFKSIIIPSVLASQATKRMRNHEFDFLGLRNRGWNIIEGINEGIEKSKSMAKFKRISLEHYLHCLRVKVENNDFNYF